MLRRKGTENEGTGAVVVGGERKRVDDGEGRGGRGGGREMVGQGKAARRRSARRRRPSFVRNISDRISLILICSSVSPSTFRRAPMLPRHLLQPQHDPFPLLARLARRRNHLDEPGLAFRSVAIGADAVVVEDVFESRSGNGGDAVAGALTGRALDVQSREKTL